MIHRRQLGLAAEAFVEGYPRLCLGPDLGELGLRAAKRAPGPFEGRARPCPRTAAPPLLPAAAVLAGRPVAGSNFAP
jgi:hypothetical protein